jgi:lipid-A-disaccharide synthase
MPRVLFVAGDASGDQHAADVAASLKAKRPDIEILAVGGPALQRTADHFLADLVSHGVMGFWEPLKKIPRYWALLRTVIRPAIARADAVVPTDFFGFNQYVAQAGKKAGKKVLYLVSPQVWASRPGRIQTLKQCVDRMLVIFPFEEALYRQHGVPVTFIGHPFLDRIPTVDPEASFKIEPVVGLLPGSRAGVVKRHLPLFLETADRLAQHNIGRRFILFAAPNLSNAFYDNLIGPDQRRPYLLEIVRDEGHQWRSALDLAITCSGSSTLENALLGIPMLVVYKTSRLTYEIAKRIVNVDRIGMVNILAGRDLAPEFIQDRATPDALSTAAETLLKDVPRRRTLRRDLLSLREKLGGSGAAGRAAEAVLDVLPPFLKK